MCNFCWGNTTHNSNESIYVLNSWDGDKVLTLDVYLDDTELTTRITDNKYHQSLVISGSGNIKFCPMCGQKLNQHRVKKLFKKIFKV